MINILIVDDKTDNLYLLQSMLDTNGFKTIPAKNGAEALGLMRSDIPDLIISDILMPVMDGFTLCRECKKDSYLKNIPFFFYTATYTDAKDEEYALSLGADRFILKPQEPDDFIKILNDFLNEVKSRVIKHKKIVHKDETVVLKEYNEVLIRKIEDKMLQSEKSEKEIKKYAEDLEKEIIKREKNELILQESQHLFQTLAQVSPVGIFRTTPEGSTTYVNPKWEELSGLSEEQAIGSGWLKAVHPEDRVRLEESWLNNILALKESGAEYRFLKPDGSITWVMGKAVPEMMGNIIAGYIGTITDITSRKQMEDALLESEIKYRKLVTQSPDGIFITDLSGKFLSVNKSICETLKYSEEELLNMRLQEIIPVEYHSLHKIRLATIMKGENLNTSAEYEVITKDGISRLVEVMSVPYYKENELIGFQGIARDVTERRLAEEALRASETQFRALFENAGEGILYISSKAEIISFNETFARMHGFTTDELKNIHLQDLDVDDLSVIFPERLQKIVNGEFLSFEVKHYHKDGHIIELEVSTCCVTLKGESYVVAFHRDITERRKAEFAISNERRMLRTLIDNVPDMIYIKDTECRKVIANKSDVKNIGFEEEAQILGKTDIELFPGPIGDRGYSDDVNVISTGTEIIEREEDFTDKNGIIRLLQTTKIPLIDKEGNITGLVGIGHDITERKRAELELIRAKEKAEESDRLKTAFLHNISHEIRTPMNAMVGFSTLLAEPDLDPSAKKFYTDTIIQSSNHLLEIITDIVDISNIEANLVKAVKKETDINLIIKSLSNQFSQRALQKNIRIEVLSGLSDNDSIVITDSVKLLQILSNLLSNAIKFTDNGSVSIKTRRRNEFIEFSVADTGIGISPANHSRIFERFYQVDLDKTRNYEGTGLGLSISKAYTELLGGEMWLTSEPGKGSVFCFTIPFERMVTETKGKEKKAPLEEFVFPVQKTILVAEDVDSNFKLINYFLSRANVIILRASNGKEAVDIALTNKNINLILMDLRMPVMDGFAAIKLIREARITIPIIAQTAYTDEKQRALDSGSNALITKPFDKKGLLQIISEYI